MKEKNWKEIRMIITVCTGIIVFVLYLHSVLTVNPDISSNEIITLPVSGINIPYWLLSGMGFILLPFFSMLIVYEVLNKIKMKY